MKTKSRNGDLPQSRKQLLAEFDRVVKKAASLTPRQHFADLVRLGIYTKNGKLNRPPGQFAALGVDAEANQVSEMLARGEGCRLLDHAVELREQLLAALGQVAISTLRLHGEMKASAQ